MAYQMAPTAMTLNDLEGHSPVVGLFECNSSNIFAAFDQISTDSVPVRSLSDSWACCSGVVVRFKSTYVEFVRDSAYQKLFNSVYF